MAEWSFLTNHAHVLQCVANDPEIRLRDIAVAVGITERAAHRLMCDLVEGGYLSKRRVGRRNCYQVHLDAPLRRAAHRHHTVGELLEVLGARPPEGADGSKAAARKARSSPAAPQRRASARGKAPTTTAAQKRSERRRAT